MNRKLAVLLGGIVVSAVGCTMAPRHTRPEAPVPGSWPDGPAYQGAADAAGAPWAVDLGWREFFTDERLRNVIDLALENNRDLKLAVLNARRARAMYGIQRAELLPTIDGKAGWSKQVVPPGVFGFGDEALTIERYDVNVGTTSWEIDLFGRTQSLSNAALEEYFATEQARNDAQILLVSAVATAYLTYAADRESLKLAQSTFETQQAAYDLIRRRFETGVSPELDLRQAQTRVDSARVDVSLYTRVLAQDQNALSLLVGSRVPEDLLPEDLSVVGAPREIAAGVSSEVLLRRPDILEAEHRLKSAAANIGAARAAFFPRITLTAAVGTASRELSGLFGAGSSAWSIAPQLTMPIFDARLWSALRVTQVDRDMAVARYEQAIQTAFREVADALAVRGTVESQVTAQESLVEAVTETYRLSDLRYTKGVDSFLTVLDAQRSMYSAQQGLIAIRLTRAANRVRLYSVLGGGGAAAEPPEESDTPAPGEDPIARSAASTDHGRQDDWRASRPADARS